MKKQKSLLKLKSIKITNLSVISGGSALEDLPNTRGDCHPKSILCPPRSARCGTYA